MKYAFQQLYLYFFVSSCRFFGLFLPQWRIEPIFRHPLPRRGFHLFLRLLENRLCFASFRFDSSQLPDRIDTFESGPCRKKTKMATDDRSSFRSRTLRLLQIYRFHDRKRRRLVRMASSRRRSRSAVGHLFFHFPANRLSRRCLPKG